MTPLCHREARLPVDRPAMSARGGDGPVTTIVDVFWVSTRGAVRQGGRPPEPSNLNQGKNPAIVHNQGISRQTVKINKGIKWATGFSLWSAGTCSRFREPNYVRKQRPAAAPQNRPHRVPSDLRNPENGPDSPSIKAKTPVIVPHQGKSRHPLKNASSPHRRAIPTRHAPSPPSLDVGCWTLDISARCPICVHPRPSAVKSPFSRISRLSRFNLPRPIKAKTPAIKAHQA